MSAMRVCAETGCPELTKATRCTEHTRAKDRARGTATERGYDADYRAQLRQPEYVNATHCTECGCSFTVDNPKTGGHTVALRNGGKGSKVAAQCRRCNYGWTRTGL